MEKDKIDTICSLYNTLNYTDKKDVFFQCFDLNNRQSEELNDFFILISLTTFTYKKMKETNSLITPLEILCKISGQAKDNSFFFRYLESISILVENLSEGIKKVDTFGLKTSQDIIIKIKEILNKWLPF